MDKNTFWGFFLIAAIIIAFSLFNRPSKEQLAAQQHYRDSVAYVRQMEIEAEEAARAAERLAQEQTGEQSAEQLASRVKDVYGAFAGAALGEDTLTVIENELLRLTFANKGGRILKAELKNYKTYGDTLNPLVLFEGDEAQFAFTLVTNNNRILSTQNLYFTPQPVQIADDGTQTFTMRLLTDSEAYMDFVYTILPADYMIGFSIRSVAMETILAQNVTALEMQWNQMIRQQERGRKFEERYATLQYMSKK